MAKYYIWFNDFQNQAASFRNVAKTLAGLESRLISVVNAMDGRASSMASLKTEIRNFSKNIPEIADRVDSIGNTVLEIKNTYFNAEKDSYYTFEDSKQSEGWGWANSIRKILRKGGPSEGLLSLLLRPYANWVDYGNFNLTTKVGALAVIDILKDSRSILKGLVKYQEGLPDLKRLARMGPSWAGKIVLKRLVGLDRFMKARASRAGKWYTRLRLDSSNVVKEQLSKYVKVGTKYGGAKVALAWAGPILTGLENTFENIEEVKSGEISTKRGIAETISETAIDLAIVGGVTLAVAAFAPAAPVILVGVAAAGVKEGLDYVTEKLTGKYLGEEKDFTELASDAVLDGGEWAMKAIKQAFNSATNCFNNPQSPTIAKWKTQLML